MMQALMKYKLWESLMYFRLGGLHDYYIKIYKPPAVASPLRPSQGLWTVSSRAALSLNLVLV